MISKSAISSVKRTHKPQLASVGIGRICLVFLMFFCCGAANSYAQNVGAWSLQFQLSKLTEIVKFPEPIEKIEQLLKEERNNQSFLKAFFYAASIETFLNPATSGQWDTIPAKGYVWRLGIHSENAQSLNLFIENYSLHPGMALYVHGGNTTAGPFDYRDNINGGVLPVHSLPGDMIIVEWNIPLQALQYNNFTITSVGYGFRDVGRITRLSSADCNIDVACKTGNHWQRESRSVVHLHINIPGVGSRQCTGILINQAVETNRKKPYILTAHHCISTNDHARGTTVTFGYEKPFCDEPTINRPAGLRGANLIATKEELDFTLLELHYSIPDSYRPFYAGWTTSGAVPQGVVGIHHPQGDVKKIAVSNTSLATGTFNDPETNLYCNNNAHWIVRRWDDGVTEKGSSGSPIFDMEHRIVGTLSGGAATCSRPQNDYYSKFSEQWNYYNKAEESLKMWLDPDNTGVTSLLGYDPISGLEGNFDVLGNISDNTTKRLAKSQEWGYLSGQNDRGWISFAEKIKNEGVANIIGIEVQVAKASETGVNVQFTIWHGTDYPVTPLETKNMVVTADYNDFPMHVFFNRMVEISGDFFIGYSLDYNSPLDTFAVYHSTSHPVSSASTMFVEESNGLWQATENYEPPIFASLGVKAMGIFSRHEPLPPHRPPVHKELKIIYQMGNDKLRVYIDDFEELTASLTVEFYDAAGRLVLPSIDVPKERMNWLGYEEINISNLPPGMYLIQAFNRNNKWAGRFVKIH